jgi:hypothetical protein
MNHNDKEDLMSFLDERIRTIAKEVLESTLLTEPATRPHEKTAQISELQQCIMAKEFVSVKEVALLLNCSDGHIRNLVSKAQQGTASNPIPFLDLDGVTVFPRLQLLEWAKQPKRKLRAVG